MNFWTDIFICMEILIEIYKFFSEPPEVEGSCTWQLSLTTYWWLT